MKTIGVIAIAALVAGCGMPNENICSMIIEPGPLPAGEAMTTENADWLRTNAQACVHRTSYRLAKGSDSADVIAKAVMTACSGPLARIDAIEKDFDWPAFFERDARLKVVEARAGNCRA